MSRGPLQRLTDEEIAYLKAHFYHDIRHDRRLSKAIFDDPYVRQWVERQLLMTADYFKIRYGNDD